MARTEVIALRTSRSKTFDNGDGTFALEVGGEHAHHLKNGEYVETDLSWHDSTTEMFTGEYPYNIKLNKGTHALTILVPPSVVPYTLAPLDRNKKAVPSISSNIITVPGLWTGVDWLIILKKESCLMGFKKTSSTASNPRVQAIGIDPTPMLDNSYVDSAGEKVSVPTTLLNSVLTVNMSQVPLGSVVF